MCRVYLFIRDLFPIYLDFVMLYYFCKCATRQDTAFFSFEPEVLTIAKARIKLPAFGWGLLYVPVLFGSLHPLDGDWYRHRFVLVLASILIIKLLSTVKLTEALLIYVLYLFLSLMVQGMIGLFLMMLPIPDEWFILAVQCLTTMAVVWLCRGKTLLRIFNYIKTNLFLKVLILSVSLFVLSILFVMNFEQDATYKILFFLGTILLVLVALIPLGGQLYRKMKFAVARYHYISNQILATQIATAQVEDVTEIRELIDELLTHISPEIDQGLTAIEDLEGGIRFLIEQKKKQRKTDHEVLADLYCYDGYKGISAKRLLSFIGLLLDNAFEAETEKPIIVYYHGDQHRFELIVANEYLEKHSKDLDIIFEKGFSTKAEDGRGYGLYELRQEIKALNGEIHCFTRYLKDYHKQKLAADYLVFRIHFQDQSHPRRHL